MPDKFKNFEELAAHKTEGEHYRVTVREVPQSAVAVVAPHGGHIDRHSEKMARAIAGKDFNLYIFSGTQAANSFDDLHVTSVHFDEPRALDLVAKSDVTVTIHGCRIEEPVVCLSSMDKKLESKLSAAFNKAGVKVLIADHPYQTGTLPENICNKNKRRQGVQIEFSRGIRNKPALRDTCVKVVRETLKAPRP